LLAIEKLALGIEYRNHSAVRKLYVTEQGVDGLTIHASNDDATARCDGRSDADDRA
jgi:hypothetical protein